MRIQALADEHELVDLCAALAVSRSGYHAWKRRAPGLRARANAQLWSLIAQAHEQSRATYGSPRVHCWLQRHAQRCGRHRVARLMREHGLRSQSKRRFRVALTDSNHDLPIVPNRLREIPPPTRRDAVWVAASPFLGCCTRADRSSRSICAGLIPKSSSLKASGSGAVDSGRFNSRNAALR